MSRRRKSYSGRPIDPVARANWIIFPIVYAKGRRLRVLIYARYSTDEQNPRSIEAQICYCRRVLEALGAIDVEIIVISDAGISGEKLFRPGINEVRDGIESQQWDLIIVEDSSRLFRNELACFELVGGAVDNGIRVICINDEVDTADAEHWEERLHEASRHHARSNKFTSQRIKRGFEHLWEIGAAVGALKPGYRRKPSQPAMQGKPEEGPYFDEIDPDKMSVIDNTYQRIAAEDSPWSVAQWLTEIKFPKATNAINPAWTDKNVIALIQSWDYRGVQRYRRTVVGKKYRTGERKATKNDDDKVLYRDMPHLRIVPEWLWEKANAAISARAPVTEVKSGADHPLAGIPRNSRGPISDLCECMMCRQKVHMNGRGSGGFRCSQVRSGDCWNKASAKKELTHKAIASSIIGQLQQLSENLSPLLTQTRTMLEDRGEREVTRSQLLKEEASTTSAMEHLGQAIELGESDYLVKRLNKRESDLNRIRAKLDALKCEGKHFEPPTESEIEERINQIIQQLTEMGRTVKNELAQLVEKILFVPYQQFGSDKIVLRAHFTIYLSALLPARTRAALAGICDGPISSHFDCIPMVVDLFERSTGPKYGLEALRYQEEHDLGLTAIGQKLGITKRQANIAVQYGKLMRAAGVLDPYIELTAAPNAASRWRSRRNASSGPHSKAG